MLETRDVQNRFVSTPWPLVQHYDRPLPRYTSYPTVPHWQALSEVEMLAGLERVRAGDKRIAVYVHVPFCDRMCLYCGCNTTVTKRTEVIDRYVDALCTEIDRVAGVVGAKNLAQLHFGGGTPSLLSVSTLDRIVRGIYNAFPPEETAEISMELDPTVTTAEHYPALKAMGFNRVSLGVQDFDDDVQRAIGRNQWATVTEEAFSRSRAAGFDRVNIDLLYGLPLQTPEHLARSAEAAAELGADRLAVFGYAHVPWMKPHQKKLEVLGLPNGETRWAMIESAREVLYENGYHPIGFDHFAKPDDELIQRRGLLNRNFQGYTVLEDMPVLAFGSTAIGDLGDRFVQNKKRLSDYVDAIESGGFAADLGCIRSAEDEARRTLIVQIMCNLEIHSKALSPLASDLFRKTLAAERDNLAEWSEQGFVEATMCHLRVTERGRPFLRMIASLFDGYLDPSNISRFSQSV